MELGSATFCEAKIVVGSRSERSEEKQPKAIFLSEGTEEAFADSPTSFSL